MQVGNDLLNLPSKSPHARKKSPPPSTVTSVVSERTVVINLQRTTQRWFVCVVPAGVFWYAVHDVYW